MLEHMTRKIVKKPAGRSPTRVGLTLHHEHGLPAPAVSQHLSSVALPRRPGDTGHGYRHLHTQPDGPPVTPVVLLKRSHTDVIRRKMDTTRQFGSLFSCF